MTDFQSFKKVSPTNKTISEVKDYLKGNRCFSLSFVKEDEITIHCNGNVCTLITAFPSNVVSENFGHEMCLLHGVIAAQTQFDLINALNSIPVGCFVRQGSWYAFQRIRSSSCYYHHKTHEHIFSDSRSLVQGEGDIQWLGNEATIIDDSTFQRFFIQANQS